MAKRSCNPSLLVQITVTGSLQCTKRHLMYVCRVQKPAEKILEQQWPVNSGGVMFLFNLRAGELYQIKPGYIFGLC